MGTALWIAQALLAVMFLAAGVIKLSQPKAKLAGQLPWTEDFSAGTVRLIGLAVLAAVGLILPPLLGVLPWLAPVAAVAIVILMLGAMWTHNRRGEPRGMAFNAVLLILAAFVAWGRFGPYPF